MICPGLQHAPPVFEVGGAIVCSSDSTLRCVRKLRFNNIRGPAKFIQECGRRGAKAVANDLASLIPHIS